jgi:hypothetical protein
VLESSQKDQSNLWLALLMCGMVLRSLIKIQSACLSMLVCCLIRSRVVGGEDQLKKLKSVSKHEVL